MTHSPAEVIARLLQDTGIGTDPSDNGEWPIYTDSSPNTPDNLIAIQDGGGRLQGRSMITGEKYEQKGITVLVRGATSPQSFTKAMAVSGELASLALSTLVVGASTYRITKIVLIGSVFAMGKMRDSSRWIHRLEAQTYITEL